MNDLGRRGAALLGGTVAGVTGMGGGSLSQIVRLRLTDGREAVVKTGSAPRAEAAMLRAIKAAGAPAPEILAADDTVLVLSVVDDAGSVSSAWPDLGYVLATLHAARGSRYGWECDYAFGPVAVVNTPTDDWPAFWGEHRLVNNARFIGNGLARRLEALAADLPNRLPKHPPPSLLHGDLWGGNVLVARGAVSGLIDPACYYGDGLVDVAMLQMFDSPPPEFFSAYGKAEAGHRERLLIYRLWPALVHLRLFGGSYRPLVERLLAELGC
jgi:fructosamine-3-kinase